MTQKEYEKILARIEVLIIRDPERKSKAGKELMRLVKKIQKYEGTI